MCCITLLCFRRPHLHHHSFICIVHGLSYTKLSFHLVYLCPPLPFHNSLLLMPHPPLLLFVIIFSLASLFPHNLFPAFSFHLCHAKSSNIPSVYLTQNSYPPWTTVSDLRMKARRNSVPPSSSVICHLASKSHEYQGTEMRNKLNASTGSTLNNQIYTFKKSSTLKYFLFQYFLLFTFHQFTFMGQGFRILCGV